MSHEIAKRQDTPIDRLKKALSTESVQSQFQNALDKNASLFCASLIDLYASDSYLQKCEPRSVIMEALKAATLKLGINKSLGYAYIVPYKDKSGRFNPTMQIGYKGYIQLAQRTGQYRRLNADCVYEGERVEMDRVSGDVSIYGDPTSDKAVGYFAYMETVTGFQKTIFWTRDQVVAHAKRFSKSYNSNNSAWKSDFDAMAIKTVIRALLSKYGVMSVEMANAIDTDNRDHKSFNEAQAEVDEYANTGDVIDIDPQPEAQIEHEQSLSGEEMEPPDEDEPKTAAAGPDF